MKILMTAHVCEGQINCTPGEELDIDDEIAVGLLNRGCALPVKAEIETATGKGNKKKDD